MFHKGKWCGTIKMVPFIINAMYTLDSEYLLGTQYTPPFSLWLLHQWSCHTTQQTIGMTRWLHLNDVCNSTRRRAFQNSKETVQKSLEESMRISGNQRNFRSISFTLFGTAFNRLEANVMFSHLATKTGVKRNLIAPNRLPPWPDPELHMYSTRNTSDLPEVNIITNELPTPLDDQVHDVIRCVQIQ